MSIKSVIPSWRQEPQTGECPSSDILEQSQLGSWEGWEVSEVNSPQAWIWTGLLSAGWVALGQRSWTIPHLHLLPYSQLLRPSSSHIRMIRIHISLLPVFLWPCVFLGERVCKLKIFFFAVLHGIWDLSSPTRDQTYAPCSQSMSLNLCTARKVSKLFIEV